MSGRGRRAGVNRASRPPGQTCKMPQPLEWAAMFSRLPSIGRIAWVLTVWRLFIDLGAGLVYPFTLLYLHDARHFPLAVAAAVVALMYGGGLLSIPLGMFCDRWGATLVAVASALCSGSLSIAFSRVTSVPEAAGMALALGFFTGGLWNALATLVAHIVPAAQRNAAFGIGYAVMNLGMGAGGFLASLVVSVRNPATFELLFVIQGGLLLCFAAWAWVWLWSHLGIRGLPEPGSPDVVATGSSDRAGKSGGRGIARDPAIWILTILYSVLVGAAVGQLDSGYPAFATVVGHVSTHIVGLAFSANTLAIVLVQLPVIPMVGRLGYRNSIFVGALFFAVSWPIAVVAGVWPGTLVASLAIVLAPVLIACGEVFQSSSIPSLANAMARDGNRGSYNSLVGAGWCIGPMVAAPISGLAIGAGFGIPFVLCCSVLCLLAGMLARHIPRGQNEESIVPAAAPA